MIKRLFGVVVAACAAIALMIGVSSLSAMHDRLRREYERYQNGTADSDEWPFSFPEDTSESQMCRVSNGWISVDQTDPVEELW